MFHNLKKALNAKNISIKAFAAVIGVCEKTAYNKINGKMEFTLNALFTTKLKYPKMRKENLYEEGYFKSCRGY